MPWLAMINQSDAARKANEELEVKYIPYLVIIGPKGQVISKDGVKEIRSLKEGAMDLWKSSPAGV